ncbi:ribosomal protection-like ABC-F family protein [Anaerocolumna xylanovorans]|uniref:ATPase components of ABC transporters with duplicated ATPase domains n=1 Tax=Anaerocolumna xylanovorans DSM 12503 TaxID=1121345 RepID=A0A1M7XWX1_9FIRM|nr:ATP-binding cassette domain-containing protein [Anaerocolumna xylanovorans]SHO43295.1 ATPase components of ABC transporters with duplicated ATPase domains [Anaerocolumna xylanovorans DSM 12503]
MKDLFVNGVKKYLDSTLVLKNINFMVNEGERAGIIGENGSGKTTILKLIAGILTLNHCAGYPYAPVPPGFDEGWVVMPKDATCAYLNQIPDYEAGVKVIDVLNLAFEEVYGIEAELRSLEAEMQQAQGTELERILRKYDNCLKLYESKGGYEVTEKLNRICKGLKFSEEFLKKDFNILSGGEKTTAALGKLLMDSPDILLLDEPTNHLDMESVEWLEEYVRNYKGTVIIVSHDRYFLDHTVTKIVEIEDMESETYQGNYTDYVRIKEENIRLWQENYKEQQKKIGAMENSVKQLREWADKSGNNKFYKRAASIQNKLEKIQRIERPNSKKSMKLSFSEANRSGNIVIKAKGLKKAYGEKILFEDAQMQVCYGERAALIGQNGSGKTTFLRMLLGEETPDDGIIEFGSSVKAAYLPQQLTFSNEELTVVECFREDISILEGAAREYLSKFLFFGSTVYKKVKYLSGGERVRLMLAKLIFHKANLLILDEPTNHLDTSSIENIENTLEAFKGTVFYISHDRYFINKTADRIVALEERKLKSYAGNYDDYKAELEKRDASSKKVNENDRKESSKKENNRKSNGINTKRNEMKIGKETGKSEIEKLERTIEELENEIEIISGRMNSSKIQPEELNDLYCKQEELSSRLDCCMEEWLKANN